MPTTRKKVKAASKIKKRGVVKPKPKASTKIVKKKKKLNARQQYRKTVKDLSSGTRTKEGARRTTLGDIKKRKGGIGKTLKESVRQSVGTKARATKINDRYHDRKNARNPEAAPKYRVIGSGARERGYYSRPSSSRFKTPPKSRKPSRTSFGIAGKRPPSNVKRKKKS